MPWSGAALPGVLSHKSGSAESRLLRLGGPCCGVHSFATVRGYNLAHVPSTTNGFVGPVFLPSLPSSSHAAKAERL
jgi:hypothetical protein